MWEIHKGTLKQWYARGYRYPVLEHSADYMITMDGDTIDYINKWLCIDIKQQEEKIRDDVVNEMLRYVLDGSNNLPKFVKHSHDSANPAVISANIEWNAETETLTVLRSFSDKNSFEEYILCDASGRVYSHGILEPSEQFSISLKTYSPGIYVFVIKNQDGINSLKFTKS